MGLVHYGEGINGGEKMNIRELWQEVKDKYREKEIELNEIEHVGVPNIFHVYCYKEILKHYLAFKGMHREDRLWFRKMLKVDEYINSDRRNWKVMRNVHSIEIRRVVAVGLEHNGFLLEFEGIPREEYEYILELEDEALYDKTIEIFGAKPFVVIYLGERKRPWYEKKTERNFPARRFAGLQNVGVVFVGNMEEWGKDLGFIEALHYTFGYVVKGKRRLNPIVKEVASGVIK